MSRGPTRKRVAITECDCLANDLHHGAVTLCVPLPRAGFTAPVHVMVSRLFMVDSQQQDQEAVDAINSFVAGLVLFAVVVAANGVGVSFMWGWFVVPFGLPAIGIAHAVGLAGMIRFLCSGAKSKSSNDERFTVTAGKSLVTATVVTGLGWLASLCM